MSYETFEAKSVQIYCYYLTLRHIDNIDLPENPYHCMPMPMSMLNSILNQRRVPCHAMQCHPGKYQLHCLVLASHTQVFGFPAIYTE